MGLSGEYKYVALSVYSGKQPKRSVLGISPTTASAFTEVLHILFPHLRLLWTS